MNPIYKFLIRQKTANLLNPYECKRKSDILMQTEMFAVEGGETYVLMSEYSTILPTLRVYCYNNYRQFVAVYDLVQNEFTLPDNAEFIQIEFPVGLNPFELGVFKKPISEFESYLNATVKPVYKDDLALEYALETNQEFYRGKLSGKLTFQMDDYAFIQSMPFDTQFDLLIYISYDNGATWTNYWSGQFWKTDCQFNEDDETAIVTPNVNDAYNAVLAGMDKEFNLIDLAPVIQPVKYDKRSLIQIYVPGQKVIGCFLSNMWWEQECEPESDLNKIINTFHFQRCLSKTVADVSGTMNPVLPPSFSGSQPTPDPMGNYEYIYINGDFQLGVYSYDDGLGYIRTMYQIRRLSDNKNLWDYTASGREPAKPYNVTLTPVADSGASGNVILLISSFEVYARRIHDKANQGYAITDDDMVNDNRNYTRVSPIDVSAQLHLTSKLSDTPTEWGIYQPGQYYVMPTNPIIGPVRCYPIARSTWNQTSLWFGVSDIDWQTEIIWRTEYELKDAYPIYSVISVLLGKVAPGITHNGTPDYSAFLYGGQSFDSLPNLRVLITPKSNVTTSGYDQPAQKAQITLKRVLDMLRDCYRLYWFIDGQNRFRIEHIEYFRRGGTYTGNPIIGTDLTQQIVTRNGKTWSFGRKQYSFDKPEMAAWYQFGWMDNQTELFNGNPLEIVSKYVNPDKIETIEIAQFSSDIDYMLLNPADISKDGFALLVPVLSNGIYKLPYFTFHIGNVDYVLQNAYAAFAWMQLFYRYDMPALYYKRNGETERAQGVKKLKTQTIKFPVLYDPDLTNLIKTTMGDGTIQKLTINLSSRNANAILKYDTE